MGYPMTFSYKGSEFARINHDYTWSVLWDRTNIVRNEVRTTSPNNNAIISIATALMAAKDNFYLTSWQESTDNDNKHPNTKDADKLDIDKAIYDPSIEKKHLRVPYKGRDMLWINGDGNWSVNWELVEECYKEQSSKKHAAISQMILAGRDNFKVVPFPKEDDDLEDDDDF